MTSVEKLVQLGALRNGTRVKTPFGSIGRVVSSFDGGELVLAVSPVELGDRICVWVVFEDCGNWFNVNQLEVAE